MKKFLYLLASFSLVAMMACSTDDTEDPKKDPDPENPDPTPSGKVELELESSDDLVEISEDKKSAVVSFSSEGGTVEIAIKTEAEWDYTEAEDEWYMVSRNGSVVVIDAEPFYEDDSRSAKVNITNQGEVAATITIQQTGVEGAYLNMDVTDAVIPQLGGSLEFEVESNYTWTASADEDWLKVDDTGDLLIISAEENETGYVQTATVTVTAGEGVNSASYEFEVTQSSGAMILQYTVTSDLLKITLPLYGATDVHISWGDGYSDIVQKTISNKAGMITHEYEESGVYEVTISGTVVRINNYTMDEQYRSLLTAIIQWGNLGVTNMQQAFHTSSISYIPEDTDGWFDGFTGSGMQMFYRCRNLTTIPEGFFAGVSASSFQQAFAECTALTQLPENLFKGSGCANFSNLFFGSTGLTTIPSSTFSGCDKVTTFVASFQNCTGLTSVPVELFDDCTSLINFTNMFNGCSALEGESPYTIVGDKKVHFYERKDHSGSFPAPNNIANCFTGCTKLSDYDAILAAGWATE